MLKKVEKKYPYRVFRLRDGKGQALALRTVPRVLQWGDREGQALALRTPVGAVYNRASHRGRSRGTGPRTTDCAACDREGQALALRF